MRFGIRYKYFLIQTIEILGIKPKKRNKYVGYFCDFQACLPYYISVQCIKYAC